MPINILVDPPFTRCQEKIPPEKSPREGSGVGVGLA